MSFFDTHQMDMDKLNNDCQALRTALEALGAYQLEYSQLEIDMDSLLGRGGFGVVRRARFDGQIVAVKILRSDESSDIRVAKALVREMKIWSGLSHENILHLIGFHLSQTLDRAIIVCPLAPHGSLKEYVRREQPEDLSRLRLALDTLNGLVYLHGLTPPVVHGDVKAANALVNQELRAVLSDFGLAVAASEVPSGPPTSLGLVGTVRWWSPELFDDKPRSTASDVWAWATLLVEVMRECVPYPWIKDNISVIKAIMKGALPETKDRLLSLMNLWSVTRLCWETSQQKRATGIVVLKELVTLIKTLQSRSMSETMTSTTELTVATTSENIVYRDEVPQITSLGIFSFWTSGADKAYRHYERHMKNENRTDLEAAIAYQREELELRPPGHRERSGSLHQMALYIHARYETANNRADLDAAIAYL
ncbi:hypothetical protein FRB94_012034 [Tulasnella sp. JGI-2019a]|nr:hypothetical protein FRB94_012034 [Tulasnella sp. JGI-2019a]